MLPNVKTSVGVQAQSNYSCLDAALKLHRHLRDRHWNGRGLVGPDVGIRFNSRLGRFIKGYLPGLHWNDDYYYLQAQGYWILANWCLHRFTGDVESRDIALQCSEYAVARQRDDGGWDYPNPEWKGRVANAEGSWVCIGLLQTYAETGAPRFLKSALRWHDFVQEKIGFQRNGTEWAVNYFAGRTGDRVPNNSFFVLRLLADLATATRDRSYLGPCANLMAFLKSAQVESGEFPYAIVTGTSFRRRDHFQCYQYNAFEALDLMRYYQVTGDPACVPMLKSMLGFLSTGLAKDGHAFFDCNDHHRLVTYNTAAVGAALAAATELEVGNYEMLSDRAFSYLRRVQRADGSFDFSRKDYYILNDHRSYPRSLTMILYHMLLKTEIANRAIARPPVGDISVMSRA
jgi:hypothetical protein